MSAKAKSTERKPRASKKQAPAGKSQSKVKLDADALKQRRLENLKKANEARRLKREQKQKLPPPPTSLGEDDA